MMRAQWTSEDVKSIVVPTLRRYSPDRRGDAVADIARQKGRVITYEGVRNLLARHGMKTPLEYMRREAIAPAGSGVDEDVARLMAAARGGPVQLDALCDELDMAPSKARALIERAQKAGHLLEVAHDAVSFKRPEPRAGVQDTGVAPTVGGRQIVGVASDLHFGSRQCMRSEIVEFVRHAYKRGVREILIPGDILDGIYKFSLYEQSHRGFEEQAGDAIETLPRLKGLTYHAIGGNHCGTFTDAIGIECGKLLVERFAAAGRNDLRYYGERQAFVRLRGVTIEMWHPRSGGSYAVSYKLQNHIRDYPVGVKPDILLVGHYHQACYLEQRGVHGLLCPCFQGPGSTFSKSLGGSPSMGGYVMSWELTAHGTLRRFEVERSSYYAEERPREIETEAV